MKRDLSYLLEPCRGCGQKPVDVAPPQCKNKAKFQCPHYASHDKESITPSCWGMMNPIDNLTDVDIWNGGEAAYREMFGCVPRDSAR